MAGIGYGGRLDATRNRDHVCNWCRKPTKFKYKVIVTRNKDKGAAKLKSVSWDICKLCVLKVFKKTRMEQIESRAEYKYTPARDVITPDFNG